MNYWALCVNKCGIQIYNSPFSVKKKFYDNVGNHIINETSELQKTDGSRHQLLTVDGNDKG